MTLTYTLNKNWKATIETDYGSNVNAALSAAAPTWINRGTGITKIKW